MFCLSAGSRTSSDDETDDDDFSTDLLRGRTHLQKGVQTQHQEQSSLSVKQTSSPAATRRRSPHSNSSVDSKSNVSTRYRHTRRTSFTRSRSPAVSHNPTNPKVLISSNSTFLRKRTILPCDCRVHLRFPWTTFTWTISIDYRKLGESLILLASLIYAAACISNYPTPEISYIVDRNSNRLISRRNNFLNRHFFR